MQTALGMTDLSVEQGKETARNRSEWRAIAGGKMLTLGRGVPLHP